MSTILVVAALWLAGCGGDDGPSGDRDAGGRDASSPDGGGCCASSADCDDGVYCNGAEVCSECSCLAGDAVACDDGIECTVDVCDEATRACVADGPDADDDGSGDATCLLGDGTPAGDDCDDADPMRHPGAEEVCDDVDRDEDCDLATFGDDDRDMDTYVDAACCNGTTCGDDCDDSSASSHPSEAESCDGMDNDCDGTVDDGVLITFYRDVDGDGWGTDGDTREGCSAPLGYAVDGGDCNDARAAVHPGAMDVCNDADDDCDGTPDRGCTCVDGRTRACGMSDVGECSLGTQRCTGGVWAECVGDVDPTAEVCNGLDDDCDGTNDDGVAITYYRDMDGDMYGIATDSRVGCTRPTGYATMSGDCNDADAGIHPAAGDGCDGIDNDCDGRADPSCGCSPPGSMRACGTTDVGECMRGMQSCIAGTWGPCSSIEPRSETCNGLDDNCNGAADEGLTVLRYRDADGDGYGAMMGEMVCPGLTGYLTNNGDCADGVRDAHPGQTMFFDSGFCVRGTLMDCGFDERCYETCAMPAVSAVSFDYDCNGVDEREPGAVFQSLGADAICDGRCPCPASLCWNATGLNCGAECTRRTCSGSCSPGTCSNVGPPTGRSTIGCR